MNRRLPHAVGVAVVAAVAVVFAVVVVAAVEC